ncbi:hypothetical protein [Chondromyces apiculatus]|uniref:Uncharacterized protein n=1 Tax=Chondromyces apiculatus DSM 436 TaxID=1192034 RepID=A0A017STZ9_9BACT|nr:hypothetical protein [Chondromyces apiculatus]EYF00040.1 Hypothetical protein CAP_1605 [Chondromyces apiculatus DSM 436]
MSIESLNVKDLRSFIFSIDNSSEPVYQVESKHWARGADRWAPEEIPSEIRAKVAELERNGKPGAFVRFPEEDDGVYVLCEKNIKMLPEAADADGVITSLPETNQGRHLSHYDIVIYCKAGTVQAEDGSTYNTEEGEYYVIRYNTWGRYVLRQDMRPKDVATTREVLNLLQRLHGKDFLSMTPDKPDERVPPDMVEPTDAIVACNCYVLNLARFKR